MMYCRRCNNTHWVKIEPRDFVERLEVVRLQRPYRCIKCERVQIGSIFHNWSEKSSRKKKKAKRLDLKCPLCGNGVKRSRRRGMERVLMFCKAYRCPKCDNRFRVFRLEWPSLHST